jgi:hypothetical protein
LCTHPSTASAGSAGTGGSGGGSGSGGGDISEECTKLCDLANNGGCAATGCLMNCLTQAWQAGGCAAKFEAMVKCDLGMSGCGGVACLDVVEEYKACVNSPGSGTSSSSGGCNEVGGFVPGSCNQKAPCGPHTVEIKCNNAPSGVTCTCLVNDSVVGTCEATPAPLVVPDACDLAAGCCAPFFAAN